MLLVLNTAGLDCAPAATPSTVTLVWFANMENKPFIYSVSKESTGG